jgi:signal transduction histidine kinase
MAYKATHGVDLKKAGGRPAASRHASGGSWPAAHAGPEDATSQSLSRLSHDIRTQLYIIIGFAELMLEEVPGKINEEQRRNLNDVLTSGRRLQALLDDIVAPPGGARKP